MAKNVPYAKVAELASRPADYKVNYGLDPLQHVSIWTRDKNLGKTPLVVLIHGGCWLNAFDKTHTNAMSTALSRAGFTVMSIEYRRTGDEGGGWPGTYHDIMSGLRLIPKLDKYFVDNSSFVIMGHSAGGHLALLAGSRWQKQKQFNSELKAVIGLAAITDVKRYSEGTNSCQSATTKFMGGDYSSQKANYDSANPINQPMFVNTILMQGDKDSIVPLEYASFLGKVEKKVFSGVGHFDWVHPGSVAFQEVLTVLREIKNQD
ncbi:alpha/beta hydrolase [Aliikangiella marina]|uniref:Alpha/beta hydrolase n=1 Tax=Aliikangiella marina TaxID=1712262 RepID=A0A545T1N9_9GAMM|nr:alpha/beta hydrolase [Aliikangiella marina]